MRGLPVFAAQFHAEKNAYEHHQVWEELATPVFHSAVAIDASAFLARVFVDAARASTRRMDYDVFARVSVWRDPPLYTYRSNNTHDVDEKTFVFGRRKTHIV